MMSRFTKAVLWGWLYLPIGFTIFALNFRIRIPLLESTWQTPTEKAWGYLATICMIAGILSLLLTPFSLIHDMARGKRKRG
jgi:hypothetical protein